MPRQYRYFSADNHFESLPETWTHRVLAKYHVIDGLPADLSPRPKSLALVNEQFAGVPEEERSAILAKTQSSSFTSIAHEPTRVTTVHDRQQR